MKKNFIFGAATAAYQIEGAYNEDGKGLSIWDTYVRQKGKIFNGDTGDVACDHYHRYKEDVALMKEIGLKAYRFSVSWTRILPNGTGEINQAGIDFYNNLIDELVANGIEPYLTLFHWDLPLELYKRGGMMNKDFPDWFADYAKVISENFSDRVKYYMTFNEVQCIMGGYKGENRAPGISLSFEEAIPIIHNILLAHGKAVDAMRAVAKQDIKISYATCGFIPYPATETPEDIEAARAGAFDVIYEHAWQSQIACFSDAIMFGKYPEVFLKRFGQYLPEGWENDMEQIHRPLDFYCQNYYQSSKVTAKDGFLPKETAYKMNSAGWAVTPEAIRWVAKFLYERYKLPIIISENGIPGHEWISYDGGVHDPYRIDFIKWHLDELEKAMSEGVEVIGYFYWSFMDNFEWAEGYKERFGLVYVDYKTQKRIIKDSGYWYKNLIEQNAK